MARFIPAPGLEVMVAQRFLRPKVDAVARETRDEARLRAPDGKVWMTALDERVRHTHVEAEAQEVPDNLKYVLRKPGRDDTSTEQATAPRDPTLSVGNRINCRCVSAPLPGAIARKINSETAIVAGTKVRAEVTCEYHRIVESEFGDGANPGARFMGGAAAAVSARHRGH